MNKICDRCGKEIMGRMKTMEYRNPEGEKIIIHNVPHENCDCYGDVITMRDIAIVEYYVERDGAIKEVDFNLLFEKYKDKTVSNLIDPEGKLPWDGE
jgi:hypothetical protein